jgi:outer membrane protein OmpA-like peptidoglycan-associated protein
MQKIDELLDILNTNKQYKIEIDGHTDIFGSRDYNIGLSAARAKYIKDYLIAKGIANERIVILGYGEKRLKRYCNGDCTPAFHRENRRAEILIYKE